MPQSRDRTPRAFALEDVMLLDERSITRAYAPFGSDDDEEDEHDHRFEMRDGVAIVSIDGPLSQRGDSWWWDGYEAVEHRLAAALASRATGIVLKVNSPGGVVAGCFEAAKRMREACVRAGKPVVAYADEMACSAAYALACIADTIVLPPGGTVGSVGVIATACDRTKANELEGRTVVVITSGARKADLHPDVPLSDAAVAQLQARVDLLAGLFSDWVAQRRGTTSDAIAALQAATFDGQAALTAGLADRVGSLADALSLARVSASARAVPTPTTGGVSPAPRGSRMNPEILALLGLPATASEQDAASAIRGAREASNTLCALTGQSSPAAALGVLVGWKAEAAQVPVLKAQLAEQSKAEAARERKELLDGACTGESPVMTPAERADFDTDPVLASFTLEQVRASIETRRKNGGAIVKTTPVTHGSTPNGTLLTPEELHVARLMNVDPQKLASAPAVKGL